jgi:hypothetical protein
MLVHEREADVDRDQAATTAEPPRREPLARDLLQLQRTAGNAAVARLMAQRNRPSGPMLQRGGFTTEDAELVGGALGTLIRNLWNRFVAYVGPVVPQVPNPPPDAVLASQPTQQLPVVEQEEPEQQLVATRSDPAVLVLSNEMREALVSVLIRRDILANQVLLSSFQAQTAHLGVTRYSPDVQHQVTVLQEGIRVLAACHGIHTNLRANLQPSQTTQVMQRLADQLFTFVSTERLGDELMMLAGMIRLRLGGVHTRYFKLSPPALQSVTGAPTLLDALVALSAAVEDKLEAQEAEQQKQKRPSRYEMETAERFRAREKREKEKKATSLTEKDSEEEDDEPTPTPTLPPPLPAYVFLGKLHDNDVYGRINWPAIDPLKQVTKLRQQVEKRGVDFHALYESAMTNAVTGASSTGIDCTKPEGDKIWVVKVSYPTAEKAGVADLDVNKVSPQAKEERKGNRIDLTFDTMVFRH